MFITDAQLTSVLSPILHKAIVDFEQQQGFWSAIVTTANNSAYWEIVSRLVARGYAKAQVDAWDRGAEFQTQIGLYLALAMGGANQPEGYRDSLMNVMDYRKLLPEVMITSAGAMVFPIGPQGVVGTGPMTPAVLPSPLSECVSDVDLNVRW